MRHTAKFVLNVAIAVFIVFVSWLLGLLISSAPMPIGGGVSGLKINTVLIPGQVLACTRQGQQEVCQIQLFDHPLNLRMTLGSLPNTTNPLPNEVQKCQVSYRDRTAPCRGDYHAFVIGGSLPLILTDSNLGLSAEQLERLREQYPQRNFFLQVVGEARLLEWNMGIAIAAGLLTFFFGWLNFRKKAAFFWLGSTVCVVSFLFGNGLLMGLGYVD